MSQENFELIRRVITAVNDRDIDGYLSCCTEDVRLTPAWAAVAGDYEGPDGIRRFFSDLGDTMPDFRIEIERLEPVRTTRVLAFLRVHATGRASGVTDSGLAVGQRRSNTAICWLRGWPQAPRIEAIHRVPSAAWTMSDRR